MDARTQAQGLSQLHRRAIPYLDDEEIYVGKFARPHRHLSAAEAAGLYMKEADPLGLEVLVPRAIRSDEIMRIRELPKTSGRRFSPHARWIFSSRGEDRRQSRRRKSARPTWSKPIREYSGFGLIFIKSPEFPSAYSPSWD